MRAVSGCTAGSGRRAISAHHVGQRLQQAAAQPAAGDDLLLLDGDASQQPMQQQRQQAAGDPDEQPTLDRLIAGIVRRRVDKRFKRPIRPQDPGEAEQQVRGR